MRSCKGKIQVLWILSIALMIAVNLPIVRRKLTEAPGDPVEEKLAVNPLQIVVMDPMAAQLSCACVDGQGQRNYDQFAEYLSQQLNVPVHVTFAESLSMALRQVANEPHVIIGKESVVRFDAAARSAGAMSTDLQLISRLTDHQGGLSIQGVVVVRNAASAVVLNDLVGRKLILGPIEDEESHGRAREMMRAGNVDGRILVSVADSLDAAAYSVIDNEADAAVLPDFMPEFLVACGKIAPGELRVIARTAATAFVGVFATDRLTEETEGLLVKALEGMAGTPAMLTALETQRGFVNPSEFRPTTPQTEVRNGSSPAESRVSSSLPKTLPSSLNLVWEASVTGPARAGISATDRFVVVADKDATLRNDLFRCFDAADGRSLWTFQYPSQRRLDYTNAPRATPVIVDGRVYVQGVWGELHCLDLNTGRVIWRKHLVEDLQGETPTWGFSVPPLVDSGRVIVAPGGSQTSLVALDGETGETVWKSPGHGAAYSSFLLATLGGVRQVVGYDVAGLGGWDPQTGRRLWQMIPPGRADFNVGTPVIIDGKVLVATENNATRVYRFNSNGKIDPEPILYNDDLAPDTCTPVVINDRVFASAYGELFCLDWKNELQTVWQHADDLYYDHTNLIGGNDRVLIWNTTGDLILIRADVDHYSVVAKVRPFDGEIESTSHPAIVGNRLYLRSKTELKCFELPIVSSLIVAHPVME